MKTVVDPLQKEAKNSSYFFGCRNSKPFLRPSTIQPKLAIGQPNDKYEQEADAMADQVMRMPNTTIQRKCTSCEKEETVQTKSIDSSENLTANDSISSDLNSAKGKGRSLSETTNQHMSQAFGTDFSNVRIHTGDKAVRMNQDLNARAFTYGNDIYFNSGEYAPESSSGKRLLAHELTHVVQQRSGAQMVNRFAMKTVKDVKSLAIHEFSSKQIANNWSFARKKFKRRNKIINEVDKLGWAKKGKESTAMQNLKSRWVTLKKLFNNSAFDPASGTLPSEKAFDQAILNEKSDMKALSRSLFKSMNGEVSAFLSALKSFLASRKKVDEEQTQFHRMDTSFSNAAVVKLIKAIPHAKFTSAEMKALVGQESKDLTNVTIAGIDPKKPGLRDKTPNPGSFVGISQQSTSARDEGIAWARSKGVTIKKTPDPRTIPLESIKLAPAYMGRVVEQLLHPGLPNPKPKGDELKKLSFAAYNGGATKVKKAAKEWSAITANRGKSYTWDKIKKNRNITGQMRNYVKEIVWRLS